MLDTSLLPCPATGPLEFPAGRRNQHRVVPRHQDCHHHRVWIPTSIIAFIHIHTRRSIFCSPHGHHQQQNGGPPHLYQGPHGYHQQQQQPCHVHQRGRHLPRGHHRKRPQRGPLEGLQGPAGGAAGACCSVGPDGRQGTRSSWDRRDAAAGLDHLRCDPGERGGLAQQGCCLEGGVHWEGWTGLLHLC